MNEKKERTLTKEQKDKVKEKAGYRCKYCKSENYLIMTVDHIVPLSRGGTDEVKNLVCCCAVCNQLKGNMLPKEFKKYLKALKTLKDLGKFEIKLQNILQQVSLYKGVGSSFSSPSNNNTKKKK